MPARWDESWGNSRSPQRSGNRQSLWNGSRRKWIARCACGGRLQTAFAIERENFAAGCAYKDLLVGDQAGGPSRGGWREIEFKPNPIDRRDAFVRFRVPLLVVQCSHRQIDDFLASVGVTDEKFFARSRFIRPPGERCSEFSRTGDLSERAVWRVGKPQALTAG